MLLWVVLYAIIIGELGTSIGIPSLFLDPEYLDKVSFWSCLIMGFTWGTFMMSYHIVAYILDAPQFSFTGLLRRPFTKFLLNNSLLPFLVTVVYVKEMLSYQLSYDQNTPEDIAHRVGGLVLGILLSSLLVFFYFVSTNQDIFKLLAKEVDKRLRKTRVMRVNVLGRIKESRRRNIRVDYYLVNPFKLRKLESDEFYERQDIIKVFDQNHLNAVIIQMTVFVLVLVIGTLRDFPVFQIPAGASFVLLLTLLLMMAGALSYWLRGWTISTVIAMVLLLNLLMQNQYLNANYEAYGLDYNTERAEYSLRRVKELSQDSLYTLDKSITLLALENWKARATKATPDKKPKMIFICASGGGQRAAVWAMRTLQYVDSTLDGGLMKNTSLITGASGGLVGAAYFRELCLQRELFRQNLRKTNLNPYSEQYLDNIAKDNLNAIMFSLVVNDLFFGFQTFEYNGHRYAKDRGFAFEQQLNRNTEGLLDKALCEYKEPELLGWIPMMILAPTIVNDGRKLFISPQNVSYMTVPRLDQTRFLNQKTKGIEFSRFFEKQKASDLRFLSALRMSATFPYVTPNVKLPSEPEMEIMDAGLSDNFGVSDAVRFLYAFKDWIAANTSGVIFVSIRDTQKDKPIEKSVGQSLFQRIFTPVTSLYSNLEYLQDITNDNFVEFARSWFPRDFGVHRVEFQYVPISQSLQEIHEKEKAFAEREKEEDSDEKRYEVITIRRAPLSWRLTQKEKKSIKRTIYELRNQFALRQLERLLNR